MRAGELDRKIIFQFKNKAQNKFGEEIFNLSQLPPIWAKQIPMGGSETVQTDQEVGKLPIKFRIRYRNDINLEMFIKFDNKYFDIISINELGRREGLIIFAKAYLPANKPK